MSGLVEKLAELEHDQWAHWTEFMLDNLTLENIARWQRQIRTPYSELSEEEKESDRAWAKKAVKVFGGHDRYADERRAVQKRLQHSNTF